MIKDLSFQPGSIVASIGNLLKGGIGYQNSPTQAVPVLTNKPETFIAVRSVLIPNTIRFRILISVEPLGDLHFVGVKEMRHDFYRPSLFDPTILVSIPSSFLDDKTEERYLYRKAFTLLELIITGKLHRIVFDNHQT